MNSRTGKYASPIYNVFEYLALFVIVLMHEFGHSLACRQVGGTANQIVLWPLGGVAYVSPPQRPGATLWSIAAGPLVNVVLMVVLSGALMLAKRTGWANHFPDDLLLLLQAVWWINTGLLIFNILPIYPLDGGQILRSLLWFGVGRARSLFIASILGFFGVAGLLCVAFWQQSVWMGVLSVFILINCWRGFQEARAMMQLAKGPRRTEFACPSCHASPPSGPLWVCAQCRNPFDTFASGAVCPHCGAQFNLTACVECGAQSPIGQWQSAPPPLGRSAI